MATPPTLTSDIQRPIQQVIDNAHVALNNPGGAVKVKQKKRKRGGEDSRDRSASADGEVTRRKKSKKKKTSPEDDSGSISQDMTNGGSSAASEPSQPTEKHTRRKKKKGKARDAEIPIDPALTANSEGPAETIASLHALIAASDPANPHLTPTHVPVDQQLIHPQFDPNAPMMFLGPFMPIAPSFPYDMQSGFVDPAGLVNGSSARFSLPELASHANEEIMRTLQGVDLAKLQGVLQVLGDAAAAAEQPSGMLHVPPGFQGAPPLPSLPPMNQNPAPSHTILGQPPKNNEPPPPPDWQQFANPAHAELLATKWMNTTKLKEMAKTEGPSCFRPVRVFFLTDV